MGKDCRENLARTCQAGRRIERGFPEVDALAALASEQKRTSVYERDASACK